MTNRVDLRRTSRLPAKPGGFCEAVLFQLQHLFFLGFAHLFHLANLFVR